MVFITEKLNIISEIVETQKISEQLQYLLEQHYVNLEATLLRAKVLREFSTAKVQYIVQSPIQNKQLNIAFLFAPFILANLNKTVIYQSKATSSVLNILNHYYQVEQKQNLKVDEVLSALNIFLDLSQTDLSDIDFLYFSLIKALCRADVSQIFLITDLNINLDRLHDLAQFFKVRIHIIETNSQDKMIDISQLNMRKLVFKNKDDEYVALCEQFSQLNAKLLWCDHSYSQEQAIHLVEDMFYTEHIYEKLSVYAEYMQTRLQHNKALTHAAFLP